jgi:EAL domain-containing protein (putative c-di-GMP-specific phosphodiesterase class I)
MGVSVTAEGIETEAQKNLLQAMGCNLGQGYWFDRPLPTDQILQRLQATAYAVETVEPSFPSG